MIKISKKYSGIIMELGNSVSPEDIIGMYNELVASEGESSPLEKYEDALTAFKSGKGRKTIVLPNG